MLQATAAGSATGNLAIIVNSENLTTWAANTTKLQADAGWREWTAKQQTSGLGRVVSQNMWVERLAEQDASNAPGMAVGWQISKAVPGIELGAGS